MSKTTAQALQTQLGHLKDGIESNQHHINTIAILLSGTNPRKPEADLTSSQVIEFVQEVKSIKKQLRAQTKTVEGQYDQLVAKFDKLRSAAGPGTHGLDPGSGSGAVDYGHLQGSGNF